MQSDVFLSISGAVQWQEWCRQVAVVVAVGEQQQQTSSVVRSLHTVFLALLASLLIFQASLLCLLHLDIRPMSHSRQRAGGSGKYRAVCSWFAGDAASSPLLV